MSRSLVLSSAAALLLEALAASPAAAAAASPPPGVTCADRAGRRCQLEIAPGVALEGPLASFEADADGLGFEFDDGEQRVTLRFCAGGPPCLETLRGTMRAAVPQIGFLSQVVTPEPPLVSVGLDTGANLAATLPLQPDLVDLLVPSRKYVIYYSRERGLEARIPGLAAPGLSSGGDSTTLVFGADFGLLESFVYFEGRLPGFPFGGKKAKKKDVKKQQQDERDDAEPETEPEEESEGPEAAFAVVGAGSVPFVPIETTGVESSLLPFTGHLALAGPIRVDPLMVLDGEVVVDLDPDGDGDHPFAKPFYKSPDLALGGNGALRVDLPFLGALFDLELGRASVGSLVSPRESRIAFSGWATTENFLAELPIPIRNDQEIRVFGQLSSRDLAGSFLHAEGAMRVDVAGLGRLTGIPLGDLLSREAVLDLSAAGLTLQGTTESRIHPDIHYGGAMTLEVHIGPKGRESYVELRGDVEIAGEGLENAAIRVSDRGMTVNGVLRTDLYTFDVQGAITSAGYRLAGSTAIADPVELNAQATLRALDDVLQQEAAQRLIAESLAEARAEVQRWLRPVQDALAAVRSAQAEVDRLQHRIDEYAGEAAGAWSSYVYWRDRNCGLLDVACEADRVARASYFYGRYTYWSGLRAGVAVPKAVADAALAAARAALRPFETNLSNAESLVALLQDQLDEATAAVAAARAYFDSLPEIRGSLSPVVTIAIENGATSGSVEARFRGRKLVEGRVSLGSPGEACLTLPVAGRPELCSPL